MKQFKYLKKFESFSDVNNDISLKEGLFNKDRIQNVLDTVGLEYSKDKGYYYTNQRNGFTFKISRGDGDIWVKTEYFGNKYKIDYTTDLEEYLKTILNEKPSFNEHQKNLNHISDIDSKISKLIKRKLDGENLSETEFLQLHKWMIKNDKEYSDSVDKQLKKDLKKLVPKGTDIK
jgi:hypothetical protein